MRHRKGRAITFCWCHCICHTPGLELPYLQGYGSVICAHQTRNGRCPECIKICNLPRAEDRP